MAAPRTPALISNILTNLYEYSWTQAMPVPEMKQSKNLLQNQIYLDIPIDLINNALNEVQ